MNKSRLYLVFGLGLVIGSISTWFLVKDKYEKLANDEINEMKEVFKTHHLTPITKKEVEESDKPVRSSIINRDKPSIMEYGNMLMKEGYIDYSGSVEREEKVDDKKVVAKDLPYIIAPEDFGEIDEYEKISYTYYSDGVVTGDNGEIIRDVGDVLGEDFADHFGDYEDDSVFVRNDQTGCDYEVLYDDRTFEEAVGSSS